MATATNWRIIAWHFLATALAIIVAGCTSPLDIDTPRRYTRINIDSLVSTDSFTGAPGDSIFAYINDQEVVFATEVQRPVFYNRQINGGYYVSVRATRYGLNGVEYEAMSLLVDNIRDTGTYAINSPFVQLKQIDTGTQPKYGAVYEWRGSGGVADKYQTGDTKSGGTIRVVRIDETRGVMTGTFAFTGYNVEQDSVVHVDRGAFRLYLKK